MDPRIDNRGVASGVRRAERDPWAIIGTLALLLFVLAFALIIWQGRHMLSSIQKKATPTRVALVATPSPTPEATPTSTPTSDPTSGPAPPAGQLTNTGATQALPTKSPSKRAVPVTHPTAPPPGPRPTVNDHPPVVILNLTPSGGKAPLLSVRADASASYDNDGTGIVSYQFNWGDGLSTAPQGVPTSSHSYLVPGTYTITVTVVDSAGLSSSDSATLVVTA